VKKILMLVAMLSIMLFSVGSVYAIPGTPDDVPGQDIVIPIVCEDNHYIDVALTPSSTYGTNTGVDDGTLNTLWAIAEVVNQPVRTNVFLYNVKSEFIKDSAAVWTANDVVNSDCKTFMGMLSNDQRKKMAAVVTVNGTQKIIYAGYIIYQNIGFEATIVNPSGYSPTDQFVSWIYQVDMPNGFAAGYNGYSVEGGVDTPVGFQFVPSNLWEGATPLATSFFFPRYFFLNTDAGTYNWWYILKGGPVVASHRLNGFICNEEEECFSLLIPTPNNFNIIDVAYYLPSTIFHTTVIEDAIYALSPGEVANMGGGFGIFATETGDSVAPCLTAGYHPVSGATCAIEVSSLGWSYQRAQTGGVITNWDVIHPMHAIR